MDPASSLRAFIEWVTRDRVYLRNYECSVQSQHADGSLDLLPDNEAMRGTGLSNVPIRHGLPGVTVKVLAGSRCLLGFADGDPTQPYAHLWDPSAIVELSFDGGSAAVARVGDTVAVSWPATLPFSGAIAGAVSGTIVGTLTIASQSAGVIQTGAARVKA